jgi:25S rRNA (uracil2634-N3)-methyltransferase
MAKKSKAKGSLFNALSSQQARLKKKSQAENAAQQRAKQEASKGKGKGKNKAPPPRMLQPFAATDRILLIGEGNFSFARALVCNPPDIPASSCGSASTSASATLEFLPPANVVATAFDTEEECYEKYPEAAEIVREIKEKGSKVIFGVDATNLHKCSALKGRRFDRVVFNFPHTGKGIADQERSV